MNKFAPFFFAALCAAVLALAAGGTSSRAANPPAPTPVVSVTTLPALPSPGVATAHPVTPSAAVPPTPAPVMGSPASHPTTAQTPALPPPGTFILIDGAVAKPAYITLDQLQHMRSTSLTLRMSGHGVLTVTGAPLAAVIDLAQPNVTGGPGSSPSAYALISGVSGQFAIVAFPEFEKDFEGKTVLLAYLVNGKPVKAGAATLVVQGDAKSGRLIEGVTHIAIVQPSPSP
ncbi:MAG TPA: hypothetical protein VKF82_10690 [Candidatus Eremiobacteraceae bacterium]|nr:hypothetical protein [Candidatus Eremiobacteraceae bacterium]